MNNLNNSIRNYELNEAKKRMGIATPVSNMTNSMNNYPSNSYGYSNLPNLSNSNSVDSNELNKAKQKMNSYSSMYSSNYPNNSMY